ncbi:tRNA lysidine(34) synthetase TilS [Aliiroseovarius subalbicans]|uniref:tRNA lysidine(34) synthetase TilS n=1 Tax=Aliiroseovarius subalbicans TaxID=2925840 RepID=UPI001F57B493|nr:tRNA lysidine(34) synthetase TilS [Aliiroseovarius subalbicans]MCI2397944.1 tRNA lysidine(34) synthetase TilS [Aliiroseovarius subalbicans]
MPTQTPDQALRDFIGGAHSRAPFASLGVAVSGGGDSMALLHLVRDWATAQDVAVHAVTVDHGLRDGSGDEAAMVAETCAALNVPHATLRWGGWDKRGNLQDAARQARYALITDWARGRVDAVALGHTQDDQAETFLMRLARGSGVDGLSAMRADWQADGLRWLRPLLTTRRAALRDVLEGRGVIWAEDPSNDDTRFDRVKARRALEGLADLGLDAPRLAQTATRMTHARDALERHAQVAAKKICTVLAGDVVFDLDTLTAQPFETQTRLLAHALMWVTASPYRPRQEALYETLAMVAGGDRRTLHGCLIEGDLDQIRISREYNAVRDKVIAPGGLWDSRWTLIGPDQDVDIRALGDAVSDCPDWRDTGLTRRSLMATPAVWRGANLVAAPLAGLENGWSAKIAHPPGHFFTSILSH